MLSNKYAALLHGMKMWWLENFFAGGRGNLADIGDRSLLVGTTGCEKKAKRRRQRRGGLQC
jgi:hypothetical protein